MKIAFRPTTPLALLLVVGCTTTSFDPAKVSIVQDVQALQAAAFDHICIEVNTQAKSAFTDELFDAIKALGFTTQSRQSAFGNECRHWMSYTGTWGGFPEHLTFAEIKVYDERARLGHIRYDARNAGKRPDRYGSAIGKLQPLLEALFVRVER